MAVAFDVASESHTGTTGSASQASFTWNHAGGASARGALVFVFGAGTGGGTNPVTSVTYGTVTMTEVPYSASDSDTEPGSVKAFYLDNCGTGTKAVVVNRTNNTVVMYAVCFTVTGSGITEVYLPGVKTYGGSTSNTAASSAGSGTGTLALASIDDGSPGTNSLRFMGRYQGTSNVTAAGSGSTAGPSIDFGLYVIDTFYETTAGQGARNVGGATITDDLAAIALAVRERPPTTGTSAVTYKFSESATGSTPVTGTSAATWKASETAYGAQASAGTYPAAVLADAPRAYWRLGEPSGATADNLAGNPTLDGTYTGTPTLGATGAVGDADTAVNFDSGTDYVQLTDNALLEPGTAFTWEAWVKRNTIQDNTAFYSKGTGGNFYGMANGTFRMGNDGGTVCTSTSTALSDTNWHHVVVTYAGTGAGNTLIYIDGAEGHTDGAQINVGLSANASNPRIGQYFGGGEDALAVIDEVAVYQSVLSAARIAAHYAAGKPVTGTAASTWKFSESATGEQASVDATGTAASTFKFSPAATGTEVIAGTSAATFKYSVATTGKETISGTSAATFKFTPAATGTETLTGTGASTWKYSIATTGAEVFTGTSAASWKYSEAASGWTAKGYAAVVWADAPVGYWRLGEANGTTAVDEMGNGNGTYVNSPTLGTTGALDGDTNTAVTFGTP